MGDTDLLLPGADHVAGTARGFLDKQSPYKSLPHGTRLSLTLADTHGASWSWHRLKGWLVQCQRGCRPSQLRGTWCWGTSQLLGR